MYLNDPSGKEKKENNISFMRLLAMTLEFQRKKVCLSVRIFAPFLELVDQDQKMYNFCHINSCPFFLHVRHL